ncbi:Hpt domain-containing protein [bacterium]|nr:Hpt domain-containing protein [bacterium]
MEFSKEDMMEIMAVFKAESAENLAVLTDKMKEIEKNPTNPAAIELLHRTSHSMKGAARMLGLTPIEEIGRLLEDGFKAAKEGRPVLNANTIAIINEAVNSVGRLIEKLSTQGTMDGIDITAIQKKLEQFK